MPNDHPSYYAVLTADVRYDNRLCANAKILYAEITALTSAEKGFAWPSNGYFSTLYKVSPQTVSEWVKQLIDAGYVTIRMENTDKGWHRVIELTNIGGVFGKSRRGSSGKAEEGSSGKAEENTLILNTPSNHLLALVPQSPKYKKVKALPDARSAEIRKLTDYYQEQFLHEYEGTEVEGAKPTWDGKIMKLVHADFNRLGAKLLGELIYDFFEYKTGFVTQKETGLGYNVFHSQIDVLLERRGKRKIG